MDLSNRERFLRLMRGEPVDRAPFFPCFGPWPQTLERWHREGLPSGEDVDFCERATALWPDAIRFVPAMAIRHAGRRTIPAMMRHHHAFGLSRGRLRLLLSERQARLARPLVMAPAVVLRRLSYIVGRAARFSPARLPATLLISPLLLLGATAWTIGFRRGLAESAAPSGADGRARATNQQDLQTTRE